MCSIKILQYSKYLLSKLDCLIRSTHAHHNTSMCVHIAHIRHNNEYFTIIHIFRAKYLLLILKQITIFLDYLASFGNICTSTGF